MDIYIYILYIYVCVCVYVSMCSIYILYIYIYVLVCLTYASIYLYSTWRSYLALQQEPVSRCLLVRDASVILQNPQSAISSDGEEHVFMPQNPWKCVATILRNLGDRFRRISWPVLNGKIINGKLKSVMHKHWKFGVLKPTDGNSWLAYSQDNGIAVVLRNRTDSNCENMFFPHPIVKTLKRIQFLE